MSAAFTIKQGDTAPAITRTLKELKSGKLEVVDLSAATGVIFRWRLVPTRDTSTATGQIVDAVNGLVQYEWAPGDTDVVGNYEGEFVVTWADGDTQTFPSDQYIPIIIYENLK